MNKIVRAAIFLLIAGSSIAVAADIESRRFISNGMSESEVLARIGFPNSVNTISGGGAETVKKELIYFPAGTDSEVMTVITVSDGRVVDVKRVIVRR